MGSKKDMDEVFERLRAVETSRVRDSTNIESLLTTMKDFAGMFKDHDTKEMAKYDKYDEHLITNNTALAALNTKVDALNISKTSTDLSLESMRTEVSGVKKVLWTGLGMIIVIPMMLGGGWTVYTYTTEANNALHAKISKLEANAIRAYDRSEVERKYGIKIVDPRSQSAASK